MNQALREILSGSTTTSQDGYPIISEKSFAKFLSEIPHLFGDGLRLLNWLYETKTALKTSPYPLGKDEASVLRGVEVLETVVRTANITAPTDLWLLRHVLSTYQKLGVLAWMMKQASFSAADLAQTFHLNLERLRPDLDFIYSRGFLDQDEGGFYRLSAAPQARETFAQIEVLSNAHTVDWAADLSIEAFLSFKITPGAREGWTPSLFETEYGFRLVPLVLALKKMGLTSRLTLGAKLADLPPLPGMNVIEAFLIQGGLLTARGEVSALGERVFQRAPGPFGIIYAYLDYMTHHGDLLLGTQKAVWVKRGENVAASRDANARTFALINESLDRFCAAHDFKFKVFIEHAVGYGEATRQRFQKDGEALIQYFGADLEDAAIDRAVESQRKGDLPKNMKFIRHADIGEPAKLIQGVQDAGFDVHNAVMVVGNGFHEIRKQTNEKMIEVFRAYKSAGIVLIFTEESALTSDDLRATGWNTYHAGFRYTHAISGQELRPVYDNDVVGVQNPIYSWEKCVTLAGYRLLKKFSTHTRTIYPHPRPNGRNPAISVNYFCVPPDLAKS